MSALDSMELKGMVRLHGSMGSATQSRGHFILEIERVSRPRRPRRAFGASRQESKLLPGRNLLPSSTKMSSSQVDFSCLSVSLPRNIDPKSVRAAPGIVRWSAPSPGQINCAEYR
jgi:hypothetical protein